MSDQDVTLSKVETPRRKHECGCGAADRVSAGRAEWSAFRHLQVAGTRVARSGLLMFSRLFLICAFLTPGASAGGALADDPEIAAAVSTTELFVGESLDYQIEIRNAENPVAPDVSPLKEQFEVVAAGDQSRNQSSTFIVNGRVSQQNVFSHIYLYRLTPKSTGELTIPSIKATIDGAELTSNPVKIRVQDAEEQDAVLVEIKPNLTTVYPTQPFTVTLRVLVQPLPNSTSNPLQPLRRDPPHIQVNWVEAPDGLTTNETSEWLQRLLAENGAGFTINELSSQTGSLFGGSRAAVFELSKGRETRNGLDGKPIEYFVHELTRSFTPQRTGSYSFGPAVVKGTFVGGVRGDEYLPRRLVAIGTSATVTVREVPTPRPVGYTGGIGEYQLAATARPIKLRVGDPLTLTLEFARREDSGSLELISAPDLSAIPEIADSFEIIDRNPTGRIEGSIKQFSYAMRPKKPDVSIPALTLSTFDPSAETFTEIATSAIQLSVSEASKLESQDLVGSVANSGSSEIQKSAAGIFQNITDPAEFSDEQVSIGRWASAVGGLWCVAGSVMAAVTLYRRKSNNPIFVRRQQARRAAHTRLTSATQMSSQGKQKDSLREVRASIVGLIADIENRVAEGLTAADVATALAKAGVPENDRVATSRLLESIEGAEYGAGDAIDAQAAIKTATALVDRIAPLLERSAG